MYISNYLIYSTRGHRILSYHLIYAPCIVHTSVVDALAVGAECGVAGALVDVLAVVAVSAVALIALASNHQEIIIQRVLGYHSKVIKKRRLLNVCLV